MRYEFYHFKAIENKPLCEEFMKGHILVLKDFGITNVTTNTDSWKENGNIHVIIARSKQTLELVGGIRIQIMSKEEALPIEQALSDLDPNVTPFIRKNNCAEVAEVCGLWNSKRVYGKGISHFLSRTAVAVAPLIGVKKLYCLAAPYTKEMAESIGFQVVEKLGNNGTFKYPIETHLARIMLIDDTLSINSASAQEKERIFDLRNSPQQSFIEKGPLGFLDIEYNL